VRKSAAQWLDQLRHPDDEVAHRARLKLGGLEGKDAALLEGLVNAVEDTDDKRRFWALIGITRLARHMRIRKADVEKLSALAERDPAFGVRQAAVGALKECRTHARYALPAIVRALGSDPSPFVRGEAARAIGSLGRLAASATPALMSALADTEDSVQSDASIALKFVPVEGLDGNAIRRIATDHENPSVRSQLEVVVQNLERGKPLSRPSTLRRGSGR
jgi:HEAT repeat protein